MLKKQIFNESKTAGTTACNEKYPGSDKAAERKQCLQEFKAEIDALNQDLKELMDQIKELQDELYELNESKDDIKTDNKEMKEKLKLIKKSLIQEYMMYQKCAHLKYNQMIGPVKKSSSKNSISKKSESKSLSASPKETKSKAKAKSKSKKNNTHKANKHGKDGYKSFSD